MKRGVIKFAITPLALLISQLLCAAPQQADIAAGSVQINTQSKQTVIQQYSDRAIINWRNFSVNIDEQVTFKQPDQHSVSLNRVTGNKVSAILGRMDANGRILLINPNGILFGKDARVNVGSLITSTTDISNQNFLKGKLVFDKPSTINAKIINQGQITAAENGLVALVAPQVSNSGVITARLGKVLLAGGEKFTIDMYGDELISFAVDNRDIKTLVNHSGVINAEAGQVVLMTARDGSAVLDNMINMSGVIKADTATQHKDGSISLIASHGSAQVSGYLSASTENHGDGGEVIVWSDDHTKFTGKIDAHAGKQSGDGGFVEVSGKKTLDFAGLVDASADAGNAGTLLLDPEYVTIGSQEAATLAMILTNGTNATVDATIDISVLALVDGRGGKAGGALTLNAGNDINVHNYIITNNGNISLNTNSGSINLYPGFGIYSGSGAVTFNTGGNINIDSLVDGTNLNLTAGGNLNVRQYLVSNNTPITLRANSGSILLGAGYNLLPGTSYVSLNAGSNITVDSIVDAYGISLIAGNSLNLNHYLVSNDSGMSLRATSGSINVASGYGLYPGTGNLQLQAGSNITTASRIESNSTAGLTLNAGNNLAMNHYVISNNGTLDATAGATLSVGSGYGLYAGAGSVSLQGSNILVNSVIEGAGAAFIDLTATNNLTVNHNLLTNNSAISLTSTNGDIAVDGGYSVYAGTANISLNAGTDINVDSAIDGRNLQLTAANDINVRQYLVGNDTPITLTASSGSILLGTGYDLLPGMASVSLTAGTDITVNSIIDAYGIDLNAGNDIDINHYLVSNDLALDLVATSGAINISTGYGLYSGTGNLQLQAGSNISSASRIESDSTSGLTLNGGNNLVLNHFVVANNGLLTATAGSDLTVGTGFGLHAAASGISLQATGDMLINSMIEGAGSAVITLTAGNNLTLNENLLTDNQAISLAATGGAISISGSYGVFSGTAALTVSSAASLTDYAFTTNGNLSLTSTAGAINISNGLSDNIGNVTLNAATDINVTASIVSMSTGTSVNMTAGNDINVDAQIDGSGGVAGGTLTMNAAGDININEHIVTNNAAVNLTAGGTVLQLADGYDTLTNPACTPGVDCLPKTKQINTGNATITINATSDYSPGTLVTIGMLDLHTDSNMTIASAPIYETVGNVELSSGGNFTTTLPVANITSGADLLIDAGGDFNVNHELGPWDGTGVVRTAPVSGGSMTLVSGGDINVNEDIVTYDGPLSLFAGTTAAKAANCSAPPCTVNLSDGNKVNAGTATLSVTSYSNLLVDGNVPNSFDATPVTVLTTTGALNIESTTGDVTFEEIIPDTTGVVTVRAGNDIIINNIIYTADANASFYAGNDFNLTAADGRIDVSHGNIWIEAINDIRANDVRTEANLTVKSTAGHILSGAVGMSDPDGGYPSSIHLAGYLGISNFSTGAGKNIDALSAAGSVTSLGFYYPGSLRIIAHDDITLSSTAMSNPMFYAGNDITLNGVIANSFLAKAGGDFAVNSSGIGTIADHLDVSAGTDPFATLTGVTVAGVAVPSWTAPLSGGNVTFGTDPVNDIVWIEEWSSSENAFISINVTNDIVLPRVHLSWSLSSAANTLDARQLLTDFTLNAGNEITLQQIETTGDVTIQTTNNDINLGSTIGAHVTVETPDRGVWNPTDLGVANLVMQSVNADINMHEARAEGDITIAAPNGQVNFIAPGGLKGIEGGGTVSVTDSDGVDYDNTISLTPVDRIVFVEVVAPAIPPGPTITSAGAPPVPGALPPLAPAGVAVAGASSPGSNSLPGVGALPTSSGSATQPGSSLPGASSLPGSTDVASAPPTTSGSTTGVINEVEIDELGEINIAAADVEEMQSADQLCQENTEVCSKEETQLSLLESPLESFLASAQEGLFLVSTDQDVLVNPLVFDTIDGTFVIFDDDDEEDEKDFGR